MQKSKTEQLPAQFPAKGKNYTELKRDERTILYSVQFYEVIKLKTRPADGNFCQRKEYLTPGKQFINLTDAVDFFNELTLKNV